MHYETPEVFEIGPADELTLGADGTQDDCECWRSYCDAQQL